MNPRASRFGIAAGLTALALTPALAIQPAHAQQRTTASSARDAPRPDSLRAPAPPRTTASSASSAPRPNALRTPAPITKGASHRDRFAGRFSPVRESRRSSIDSQMSVQSNSSQASVVLDRAPASPRDASRAANAALGRTTRQVTFNYARMPVHKQGAGPVQRLANPVSTSARASIGPSARSGGFAVSRLKSSGRAKASTSRSGQSSSGKGKGKKRK